MILICLFCVGMNKEMVFGEKGIHNFEISMCNLKQTASCDVQYVSLAALSVRAPRWCEEPK